MTPRFELREFFGGLAEFVFEGRLGVADPPLVDYVAEMLTRFVRFDAIYRVRTTTGQRLEEIGRMLAEADQRVGDARREVHRHIGDFTLFWTGVYPEALRRAAVQDRFHDYCSQGKRAYLIASTIRSSDDDPESSLFARMSHDYDLCVYGLSEVRKEWERRDDDGAGSSGPILIS
jgi:hypothetical protein